MFFFAGIGRSVLYFLQRIGDVTLFFYSSFIKAFCAPFYIKNIKDQCIQMGYYSLPVVGLTAIFSGMVLALQSYSGFSRFSAEGAVATVVVLSMTRELGPVLAGLMVAGRMASSIAAEIGTMRVSEQIDALSCLNVDPFRYLMFPRLISGLICLPLLVLIADSIGVFGGYLVGIYQLGFNPGTYMQQTLKYLEWKDVLSGLIKAIAFGFAIAFMGCYHGYFSKGGAKGVGQAVIDAVVWSCISILILNYLLTTLLF